MLVQSAECDILDERRLPKLLAAGADINGTGRYAFTALHFVSHWGSTRVVQALLLAGADPNARSTEAAKLHDGGPFPVGTSPLQAAAYHFVPDHPDHVLRCKAEVVRMLLAAGADPCAADSDGWTPLHQAAQGTRAPAAYDWMDWEPWDPDNQTSPLVLTIEALLAAGARLDAEAHGCGGITPEALFEESARSHLEVHLGREVLRRMNGIWIPDSDEDEDAE